MICPKLWRKDRVPLAKRGPQWMLAVPLKMPDRRKSLSERSRMNTTSPRCSGRHGALSLPTDYWESSLLVMKRSKKKRSICSLATGVGSLSAAWGYREPKWAPECEQDAVAGCHCKARRKARQVAGAGHRDPAGQGGGQLQAHTGES